MSCGFPQSENNSPPCPRGTWPRETDSPTETSSAPKNKVTLVYDNKVWDSTVEENFAQSASSREGGPGDELRQIPVDQETVSFLGMEITKNAIRPAREYLDALRNFPEPKNISSLRSFYCMIKQINFAFTMNEHMASLVDLVFVFVKSCLTSNFRWCPS